MLVSKSPRNTALVLLQIMYKFVEVYKLRSPHYFTEVDRHFLKSPVELISNFSTQQPDKHKVSKSFGVCSIHGLLSLPIPEWEPDMCYIIHVTMYGVTLAT